MHEKKHRPQKSLSLCADQLQRAVERGEYAEAARLLEAVQQLAAHFQAFGSVPKVIFPYACYHLFQISGEDIL